MNERNELPPEWMLNLLRMFCPPAFTEEIEGDLIERYRQQSKVIGEIRAKRKLFWSIIRFFRPGILLRNNFNLGLNQLHMLSNYFKIALRVMFRNVSFTAINVSGLVLGITGGLLLFLWIQHDFSYDQFHTDKDQLHIAWNRAVENGQVNCWSITPRILAPTLEKEFAGVENAVSYASWSSTQLFTKGDTKLLKTSGIYTDAPFLTILSYPLLKGDQQHALQSPNSIVLTESFAKQLFGEKEAFGETVKISQDGYSFDFTVSGVLKDLPSNTAFSFEYIIPIKFLESLGEDNTFWGNNSVTTLVKLKPGTNLNSFNETIKGVVRKHYADGQHIEIFLYPLTKMRLYSRFENGVAAGGRIEVMRMLGILGVCLVVIACINFINLSTARAQRRSKEVAIRKVTGAARFSVILQFLCESMLIAFVAGIIAIVLCYLLIPYFNQLINQNLRLDLASPATWVSFLILIFTVGLLAGSYPAFYLSGFLPARILKGMSVKRSGGNYMRSILVTFQFGFAVTMIVSAIVVSRQIEFVQKRDTGYNRDNLIHIPLIGDLQKNFAAFKNELIQKGAAVSVSKTSTSIAEQWSSTTGIQWQGKNPENRTDFQRISVDQNVTNTFGVTIIEGRDLDPEKFPSDSAGVLLNETALKTMGFTNPLGEKIFDDDREYHVVGVVKDFVFLSPFQKVEPIVLLGSKERWSFNVVYLKLNSERDIQKNLALIEQLAKKYNPEYPFEYQFADVEYQKKFHDVKGTLNITTIFTGVAIFIACLGLLGLAIYMTEARMKEIGVRKVLGGSVLSITRLLSLSSLKPVLISIVIFAPFSWWAMTWWLQSFVYRISLDLSVFVLAALCTLGISLLTIIAQTISAARSNPVLTLKNE